MESSAFRTENPVPRGMSFVKCTALLFDRADHGCGLRYFEGMDFVRFDHHYYIISSTSSTDQGTRLQLGPKHSTCKSKTSQP